MLAAEILAKAAFLEGKHPQSFPFFGVERRGAPVTAYSRIDDKPVGVRTSITEPDVVVVLDASLLKAVNVTAGLKKDGLLVANTHSPPEALGKLFAGRVATVDATAIAIAHGLGSRAVPILNTAMLGALVQASGVVRLESVLTAIESSVPAKPTENRAAATDAAKNLRVLQKVVA